MNKIRIILITLLVFILLNAIIVFLWPIRTNLKFANFSPYSQEYSNSLNLKKDEILDLYLETWQRERLFEYQQYTGITESESVDGKYVNISKEKGRLVPNNPEFCERNVFFYGGENVFGYDVTDNQTIPFYFKDILESQNLEFCVFNFGRRTFFSTQENILFQNHIYLQKIREGDLVIFIDGDNEIGNNKIINTDFIEENYNELHQKYWKLYKVGIKNFLNLLPITQFYNVLFKRNNIQNDHKFEEIKSQSDFREIVDVYKININIRNLICENYQFNCYNILFLSDPKKRDYFKRALVEKNLFELNNFEKKLLRNKFNSLNPESNNFLANEIFKLVSIN